MAALLSQVSREWREEALGLGGNQDNLSKPEITLSTPPRGFLPAGSSLERAWLDGAARTKVRDESPRPPSIGPYTSTVNVSRLPSLPPRRTFDSESICSRKPKPRQGEEKKRE